MQIKILLYLNGSEDRPIEMKISRFGVLDRELRDIRNVVRIEVIQWILESEVRGMERKKESAATAAEVLESIETGELTTNQARAKFGLEPIDEPTADAFLKKE